MDLGQLTLAEITKILEALDSGLTEVKVTNEAASPVNVVLDAAMVTKINELHAALVVDKDAGFQLTGRSVAVIYGVFAVGAAAVTKAITNRLCTVNVLSGNCWINPSAAAVADATAIKLTLATGNTLDLIVAGDLSLISDATGASVQIIVWA